MGLNQDFDQAIEKLRQARKYFEEELARARAAWAKLGDTSTEAATKLQELQTLSEGVEALTNSLSEELGVTI